jgi:hypothetical protein
MKQPRELAVAASRAARLAFMSGCCPMAPSTVKLLCTGTPTHNATYSLDTCRRVTCAAHMCWCVRASTWEVVVAAAQARQQRGGRHERGPAAHACGGLPATCWSAGMQARGRQAAAASGRCATCLHSNWRCPACAVALSLAATRTPLVFMSRRCSMCGS